MHILKYIIRLFNVYIFNIFKGLSNNQYNNNLVFLCVL